MYGTIPEAFENTSQHPAAAAAADQRISAGHEGMY
jgi:hypothetical protein